MAIEFGLYDERTGECLHKAMGRKTVQKWAIQKGYIKVERTKNFRHILMGDFDIRATHRR